MNRKQHSGAGFKHRSPSFEHRPQASVECSLGELNLQTHDGSLVTVLGSVDRVVQTSGPTLFVIRDGSGTLTMKGFEGAGVRAYPSVVEGSMVKALVEIKEFGGAMEGEIMKMYLLKDKEAELAQKELQERERKRAAVSPPAFLAHSPILEKLKDRFTKAATEIRLAILQNRPIIVRHHNDADGYCSGFAIERAIVPLIEKQHGPGKAAWEYYTRAPCAAPMYEIEDSIKDAATSLRSEAKFSNKMPLVVIVDTGSGEESLMGIQQGRIHGIEFIVVDHHVFDEKDVTSPETLVHINPFLVGEDGAKYSAGMLCTEFARFINPAFSADYIAAMAGLADRIDNKPVMDTYLKIAHEKGYTKQMMHDIAAMIDFVSAKLRFMEAREYIETVFGEPMDKQKKLVALLGPYIRNLEQKGLAIAEANAVREKIGKVTVQFLEVEQAFPRGAYPKPGMCVGMLHDKAQVDLKTDALVSVGVLPDLVTIRATEASGFSVHTFIEKLEKELPKAFPNGGGHHLAGAVKFTPTQRENVLKVLRSCIKK
jgi:RecJ-like exonuclease